MRKTLLVIIIFLCLCLSSIAEKGTVAVLDMETENVSEQDAGYLTRRIRHELFLNGKYKVLERASMEEILTEQGFQLTGCTSSECAVQAGQLLGVQFMVAGSIGKIGSMYTIFLRLIDVESGEITASATIDSRGSIEDVATNTTKEAVTTLLGGQSGISAPAVSTKPASTSSPLPGLTFVTIPSGSFMMGSNDGESDEKPVHNVYIKSFKMMTTEVTVGLFRQFVNETGYQTEAEKSGGAYVYDGNQWGQKSDANWSNPYFSQSDDHPVVCVGWNDCKEYIQWLNRKDPGKGYRLPTESEWEYACRAGSTTKYYSGNSDSDLGRAGWYSGNSGNKTYPVGQKTPNAWGLYDMHGNVWEWCEDVYHDSYNGAPADGSAWLSPSGQYRVLRGGAWSFPPFDCRSAARDGSGPDTLNRSLGFRLCASL